jgi:hypothetical protein
MLVRVRRLRAVELFANGAIYSFETVRVGHCEWVGRQTLPWDYFRVARHSGAIPRIAVVSREQDRFYVSPPYVSGPSEGSHAALTGALFLKPEH